MGRAGEGWHRSFGNGQFAPSPVGGGKYKESNPSKIAGNIHPSLGMPMLHLVKHKPKTAPSLSFHPNFTNLKIEMRQGHTCH